MSMTLVAAAALGLSLATLPRAAAGTGVLILSEERTIIDSYNAPQFVMGPNGQVSYTPATPNVHRQKVGAALVATPSGAQTAERTYSPVGDNTWYTGTDGKPAQARDGAVIEQKGKSYKIVGEQGHKLIFKSLDDGKYYSAKIVRAPAGTAAAAVAAATGAAAGCPTAK